MTLWTPGGEYPVGEPRERPGPPRRPEPATDTDSDIATVTDAGDEGIDLSDLTDEERARLEDMAAQVAEVRRQLLATPASAVVANHVTGLYELAAIHLSADRPKLAEARLAIDAMAALVEGLGGRLGDHEPTLRDALAQLRIAFVQVQASARE